MFLAGAAVAFLLARNCDLDATAGAWPPRGARAAAQRPARLPDGYHHTLRCMVAFRGTMAANAWRAEGKRERSVSLGDFAGGPLLGWWRTRGLKNLRNHGGNCREPTDWGWRGGRSRRVVKKGGRVVKQVLDKVKRRDLPGHLLAVDQGHVCKVTLKGALDIGRRRRFPRFKTVSIAAWGGNGLTARRQPFRAIS